MLKILIIIVSTYIFLIGCSERDRLSDQCPSIKMQFNFCKPIVPYANIMDFQFDTLKEIPLTHNLNYSEFIIEKICSDCFINRNDIINSLYYQWDKETIVFYTNVVSACDTVCLNGIMYQNQITLLCSSANVWPKPYLIKQDGVQTIICVRDFYLNDQINMEKRTVGFEKVGREVNIVVDDGHTKW